ncbi:cation efflux family-domain-containing protein [Chlamydoabsidia padenii]|nr:cation efflux family-domain-containing protein [Chlamydoabsidia padenii]
MKALSGSGLHWGLFKPFIIRNYHLSKLAPTGKRPTLLGCQLILQHHQHERAIIPPTKSNTQVLAAVSSLSIRHHVSSSSQQSSSQETHDAHVHVDLVSTLEKSGKVGVQITLVGLLANVGLTATKGVAGWIMNSASLLADAAHSFSDLLSDFVTLYTFKMSRKPPDAIYPYGYGKYETVGSFAVSTLLITGGVAIGLHSLDLLTTILTTESTSSSSTTTSIVDSISSVLSSTATSTVDSNAVTNSSSSSPSTSTTNSPLSSTLSSTVSSLFHIDHHPNDNTPLDPNAAWFALASVIVKEWLYQATIKIGKREHSDILIANAWHHRSDAYSSMIALVAIGGSYAGMPVLDPLGGLLVSALIVKSGAEIMASSVNELVDQGLTSTEIDQIRSVIAKVKEQEPHLVDYYSIRGRKLGPFKHLDMILQLDPMLPVKQAHRIEQRVRATVKNEIPMVQEILIHVDAERQPPHH